MNGMKAKNVDGRSGSACYWEPCPCYEKVADDRKLMETQEELTEIVRDHFSDMGKLRPSMFKFMKVV